MKLLFDRLSQTLEHAMDFRLERSNMIAANLANVDTPGYTPAIYGLTSNWRIIYEQIIRRR